MNAAAFPQSVRRQSGFRALNPVGTNNWPSQPVHSTPNSSRLSSPHVYLQCRPPFRTDSVGTDGTGKRQFYPMVFSCIVVSGGRTVRSRPCYFRRARRCARRARVRMARARDSSSRWLRTASGWAAAQRSGSNSSRHWSSACRRSRMSRT